jgi:hypothetical protein
MPVILFGREAWLLASREGRRLRVFENRALRRLFGRKRGEVRWKWRRQHNDKLNDLYSSPNIVWVITSKRTKWAGNVARMGEKIGAYRVLVGKPELKRPLGRPRRRREDDIKVGLQEVEWRGHGLAIWLRIGTGGGHL